MSVTVGTIYHDFGTHDGRRIIARLQKHFALINQHIHSEHLKYADGKPHDFKTYWKKDGSWDMCFCHPDSLVKT
jgi:hypothetical protein